MSRPSASVAHRNRPPAGVGEARRRAATSRSRRPSRRAASGTARRMRSSTSSRRAVLQEPQRRAAARTVDVQRSEPCFARFTRCRIWCGACTQPTRTPGAKTFETRADVDHAAGRVERAQARQRLALEAQPRVRLVLDDQQVALLREPHDRAPALRRHRHAGRVLERRDDVEELRRRGPRRPGASTASASRSMRMPSASTATWCTSAPRRRTPGPRPGRSGPRPGSASPGSTSTRQIRSSACWPPVVTISSPAPTSVPSSAIRSAMAWRSSSSPSVGPVLERARTVVRGDVQHQLGQQIGREGLRVGQAAGQRDHLGPRRDRHQVAHRRRPERAGPVGVQPLVGIEAREHGSETTDSARARPRRAAPCTPGSPRSGRSSPGR